MVPVNPRHKVRRRRRIATIRPKGAIRNTMLPRPVNQEVRPAVALHPLPPPSCAGGTGVKVGRATLTVVAVGFIGVTVGAAVGAAVGRAVGRAVCRAVGRAGGRTGVLVGLGEGVGAAVGEIGVLVGPAEGVGVIADRAGVLVGSGVDVGGAGVDVGEGVGGRGVAVGVGRSVNIRSNSRMDVPLSNTAGVLDCTSFKKNLMGCPSRSKSSGSTTKPKYSPVCESTTAGRDT